jgi:hypothetical protein
MELFSLRLVKFPNSFTTGMDRLPEFDAGSHFEN